jgi:hypothetical protein
MPAVPGFGDAVVIIIYWGVLIHNANIQNIDKKGEVAIFNKHTFQLLNLFFKKKGVITQLLPGRCL